MRCICSQPGLSGVIPFPVRMQLHSRLSCAGHRVTDALGLRQTRPRGFDQIEYSVSRADASGRRLQSARRVHLGSQFHASGAGHMATLIFS